MSFAIRIIGALVVTYLLSRMTRYLMRPVLQGRLAVLAAHLLSFLMIALVVGIVKAYWVSFLISATYIYIVPQIIWLIIDLMRYRKV